MNMKITFFISVLISMTICLHAEDGHKLWLRNKNNGSVNVICKRISATIAIAKEELEKGWQGKDKTLVELTIIKDKKIIDDGFKLSSNVIQANTDLGILYGVYELLRHQQTGQYMPSLP